MNKQYESLWDKICNSLKSKICYKEIVHLGKLFKVTEKKTKQLFQVSSLLLLTMLYII